MLLEIEALGEDNRETYPDDRIFLCQFLNIWYHLQNTKQHFLTGSI